MVLFGAASFVLNAQGAEPSPKNLQPEHVFQMTNLWTVHFKFTPEQWQEMEPKGGLMSGMFGMFGGGRGGPGGFQMPQEFGTGMFLAPAFLKAGDRDGDNKLSKEEFAALGAKWFSDWDTNQTGALKVEQVCSGLKVAPCV